MNRVMFRVVGVLALFAAALVPNVARADVPGQINHQGQIKVNGTLFNGTGQFRFAIFDPDTGQNYWTNDNTFVPGPGTPTAFVSITVTDGIYSVMLGDTSLTNMTNEIPPSIFKDDNAALRVWFNDGINGVQQFDPHPLAATPYSFRLPSIAEDLNGNVGVGVAGAIDPSIKFDVEGQVNCNRAVRVDGNSQGSRLVLAGPNEIAATQNGPNTWVFDTDGNGLYFERIGSGVKAITINSANNVGIGSNSLGSKLHISSGTPPQVTIDDTVSRAWGLGVSGDFYVQDITAGPVRLKINGSGSVGMGGDPNGPEKLQVFGSINASGNISCSGNISANGTCCTSDARFKRNIRTIDSALDRIGSIRGVNFDWRTNEFPSRNFGTDPQVGFVAQELQRVLPEVVVTQTDGTLAVDYGKVTPLLIEGIKELSAHVDEKQCRIESLETELEALRASLREIQASVARLAHKDGS